MIEVTFLIAGCA